MTILSEPPKRDEEMLRPFFLRTNAPTLGMGHAPIGHGDPSFFLTMVAAAQDFFFLAPQI